MSRHAKKKQNNLAVEKVVEGAMEITTNVKKTSAKKHRSEKNKLRKQPHVCYIFSIALSPHELSSYISFVSISIAIHFSVSNLTRLHSHLQTLTM